MNHHNNPQEQFSEEAWQVRPYSKSELAQAYAPDIAPTSALNRLAQWIKLNQPLIRPAARLHLPAGGADFPLSGASVTPRLR